MNNHQKKLEEQFVVEQFLDAHRVFARDPLNFIDRDGNKVDDRLDGAQGPKACGDEADEI